MAQLPVADHFYDGVGISAWMDRDPSAELAAQTVAAAMVDAAIPDAA